MTIARLLEILDRTRNGPICTVKEWNTKVIPSKTSQKLKEHGLSGTCTPENPVNSVRRQRSWHKRVMDTSTI